MVVDSQSVSVVALKCLANDRLMEIILNAIPLVLCFLIHKVLQLPRIHG